MDMPMGTIVVVEVVDRLLSVAFLSITMRTFAMDKMASTVLVVDAVAVNTPSMLILEITVAAQDMRMSTMVRIMLLSVSNDTSAVFTVSRAKVLGEERVTLVESMRSLVVSNELALAEAVSVLAKAMGMLSITMGTLAIAMRTLSVPVSMLSFTEKILAVCKEMLAVRVVVRMLAVSVRTLSVAVMTLAVSRVKIMVVK